MFESTLYEEKQKIHENSMTKQMKLRQYTYTINSN